MVEKIIVDSTIYQHIENPVVRVSTRVGEQILSAALLDPIFQRQLVRAGIEKEDFASDHDGLGLIPDVVINNIEAVGGKGDAIRVVGVALDTLDNFETLNVDKYAVRDQLIVLQEQLRRDYRREKVAVSSS